jgi:hypothetical protein
LYAADRDAAACRVDDVARTGCASTNDESGPYLRFDPSGSRANRCRSRGISAEIVALYQGRVAVVLDPAESTVRRDHISGTGRGAADNVACCVLAASVAHLDGGTVTNYRCAIGIHADEIACHKIIVAAHEDQCLVYVSDAREAESLDSGTGTIARQSAFRGRTKLDHPIASGVADDLDADVRVIADRECVRACARLGVAIDDHRLAESETEAIRQTETLGKRDCANVRGRVAAGIAGRNVKRDEVRRSGGRRMRV